MFPSTTAESPPFTASNSKRNLELLKGIELGPQKRITSEMEASARIRLAELAKQGKAHRTNSRLLYLTERNLVNARQLEVGKEDMMAEEKTEEFAEENQMAEESLSELSEDDEEIEVKDAKDKKGLLEERFDGIRRLFSKAEFEQNSDFKTKAMAMLQNIEKELNSGVLN